jgi:hypothetical protein
MAVVDTSFKVHEIHTAVMSSSEVLISYVLSSLTIGSACPTLVQSQALNGCRPPSRIFSGRRAILDEMHDFFSQDLRQQHIYVLYGLGGAGKSQISLKFIEEWSR